MTSHPEASAQPARPPTQAHRPGLAGTATLRQLWDLHGAAYAVEAGLTGSGGIPAFRQTLAGLRGCGEAFPGVSGQAGLAGAVSRTRQDDATADICRLVAHPRAHRRGIATTLPDRLDADEPADPAVVCTATANGPALALYQQPGFLPGQRQIAPGVTITLLNRQTRAPAERSRTGDHGSALLRRGSRPAVQFDEADLSEVTGRYLG